jgi:hypothetical protein
MAYKNMLTRNASNIPFKYHSFCGNDLEFVTKDETIWYSGGDSGAIRGDEIRTIPLGYNSLKKILIKDLQKSYQPKAF